MLPDGMSYRVLVLQNCTSTSREVCDIIGGSVQQTISSTPSTAMSLEVLRKIGQLVRDGATVVGPRPEKANGLKNYPTCDEDVKTLAAEIWGDTRQNPHRASLRQRPRDLGKPLGDVLRADGVKPNFIFRDQAAKPSDLWRLDFIHRAVDTMRTFYFVSNLTNRPRDAGVHVSRRGPAAGNLDPVSGKRRDAVAFKQADGCMVLPLEFAPFESYFVVFRKPIAVRRRRQSGDTTFPNYLCRTRAGRPFDRAVRSALGRPGSVEFPELVSWTKRPEEGIKFYSGKATYRKPIRSGSRARRKKVDNSGRLFLDLGNVRHVAEVRLNGKKLGVLWTAPWRVEITDAVRVSGNVLEVDIINLWVNRVVGDLNLPKEKRITETHDIFRFGMVRPSTPLLDSGLFGPVTLQQAEDRVK